MSKNLLLLCLIAVLSFASTVCAEDVFRFRGENSQGKYAGTGLLKSWPEDGPKRLWLNDDLNEGWGSVSKIGDRIYLNCLDSEDAKKETVVCLDLNGKKLWQKQIGGTWPHANAYPLPRSTPTYVPGDKADDAKLVILSGNGELFCLTAKDGTVLWNKHMADTYETTFGNWGMAESVIVKDGIIFVTVCGKKALAVAMKLENGDVIWETPSNDDTCNYVTPIIYNDEQLVIMTAKYVTGLDLKTGKSLWQEDYQEIVGKVRMAGINCITPLLKGNRFFVTSGFGQGGVMFEILPDGKGVKQCWANKELDPYYGGVVELDGRIYGASFRGNWMCLDWETGETIYNTPWDKSGKGAIIVADDMLYLYEERRGTMGLVKPGDTFELVSSFPVEFGSKEHWAHPVICDGVLYVRHGKGLAAYDLRENQ